MRGFKVLLCASALLTSLALVPAAKAQLVIGIGGAPPVCSYGYYDYAPYSCAPYGFYGPGYFYSGIFLGVGPWSNWGYGHGWGEHRFSGGGGGRYVAGGRGSIGSYQGHAGGGAMARGGNAHAAVAHSNGGASRAAVAHSNGGGSHAAVAHGNGGASHAAVAHGGGGGGHAGGGGEHAGGGGGGGHGGGGGRR